MSEPADVVVSAVTDEPTTLANDSDAELVSAHRDATTTDAPPAEAPALLPPPSATDAPRAEVTAPPAASDAAATPPRTDATHEYPPASTQPDNSLRSPTVKAAKSMSGRVTLPVKIPPSNRSAFASDQLLFLADTISMTKSSTRFVCHTRVVSLTRQSLFICQADSVVKRTVPVEAIVELTSTDHELLIHIPPSSDVLLKNDGKKAEQEELIGILALLYKFHHGAGSPDLKINVLDDDAALQSKAKLPEGETVDVKTVLDEMLKNVKKNQIVKQNLPPPPPDRTEKIQAERLYLEEKLHELKKLEEEVARSDGTSDGLKMERDAIARDCEVVRDDLQRLEITIMPALRHKKNVAVGMTVVTNTLMGELLRVQKALVYERSQRDADTMHSLREMEDNYDALLLRKQDEIDALEQKLFAAQRLNDTLQLAVDNVVRTTTSTTPSSPSPPSQRDYFLRKMV